MKWTKEQIEYKSAPGVETVTIPANTPVISATNLPTEGKYWVEPWYGMSDEAKSWQRNYGFLVGEDEVIGKDFTFCVVFGKRWFDKRWGNTYHSVTVNVDGKCIGRVDYEYGYGDQYIQTAHRLLQDAGYFPKTADNFRDYSVFLGYRRDHRDKVLVYVADVGRKSDL